MLKCLGIPTPRSSSNPQGLYSSHSSGTGCLPSPGSLVIPKATGTLPALGPLDKPSSSRARGACLKMDNIMETTYRRTDGRQGSRRLLSVCVLVPRSLASFTLPFFRRTQNMERHPNSLMRVQCAQVAEELSEGRAPLHKHLRLMQEPFRRTCGTFRLPSVASRRLQKRMPRMPCWNLGARRVSHKQHLCRDPFSPRHL